MLKYSSNRLKKIRSKKWLNVKKKNPMMGSFWNLREGESLGTLPILESPSLMCLNLKKLFKMLHFSQNLLQGAHLSSSRIESGIRKYMMLMTIVAKMIMIKLYNFLKINIMPAKGNLNTY